MAKNTMRLLSHSAPLELKVSSYRPYLLVTSRCQIIDEENNYINRDSTLMCQYKEHLLSIQFFALFSITLKYQ